MSSPQPSNSVLSWEEARTSPCEGCSAECCTVLPLQDFQIQNLSDLDWCFYLLNFQGIELKLMEGSGMETWQVCIHIPCRKLDSNRRCSVHGTAEQPDICKRFNPYGCSYRRIYQADDRRLSLRIDRERLSIYAGMALFNDAREIILRPSFQQVATTLASMPPPPKPVTTHSEGEDQREQWEQAVRSGSPVVEAERRSYGDFQSPCQGCSSWCCSRLFFPLATPLRRQNLDYIYFLLGFPGVEVGMNSDGSHSIIVRTQCQHLQRQADGSGSCGLYGKAERPQTCTYYDAGSCAYKEHFGGRRPRNMLRLRYPDFPLLSSLYQLDADGYITTAPTMAQVTEALEAQWREGRKGEE